MVRCHKPERRLAAMMIFIMGILFLSLLLRLMLRLRLGIPMLYVVLMLTVFHDWYQVNAALADSIFFALVGLAALSWVVTAVRKLYDVLDGFREDRAMAELLADRVRQARASGQAVVNTEGLW